MATRTGRSQRSRRRNTAVEVLGVGTCVALGVLVAVAFGGRDILPVAIAIGAAIGVAVGLLAHFGPHRKRKGR